MKPRFLILRLEFIFLSTIFTIVNPLLTVQAELVDRIVAVVNDEIILMSELEEAENMYRKRTPNKQEALSTGLLLSSEEKMAVLDELINEKLTLQKVNQLGLSVDDEEIDATISRIKEVNKLSDEAMLRMVELEGMTYESYRKKIKNQLLQNRLVNNEIKSKVVITDGDVDEYFESHKEDYIGKEKYHLRQLLMKVHSNASENDREAIYQKMLEIRKRLLSGEDFIELAMEYSQGPSAKDGGELGFFELRLLTPQIRQAIGELGPGHFTDIIESNQGFQILFVEEINNASGQSRADAEFAIQEKLYAERMEEKFKSWLKELRNEAHIKIME